MILILNIASIALALCVLTSAAIHDVRTREIPDIHWILLGTVGAVLAMVNAVNDLGIWHVLFVVACIIMTLDIAVEHDASPILVYLPMGAMFVVSLYMLHQEPYFVALLSVPVSYLLFLGLYLVGIMKGGADVKCAICLAASFPTYPVIGGFPLLGIHGHTADVFTFTISVFFIALILVIIWGIFKAVVNLKNGVKGIGTEMPIERARHSFVWPVYDVENGELVRCVQPDDPNEVYDRLEAAGHSTVVTTPMIPFLLPMLIAFIIVVIVGSPFTI